MKESKTTLRKAQGKLIRPRNEFIKTQKAKSKEIIKGFDISKPQFATELFKFAREWLNGFDYERACEYANFSMFKDLNRENWLKAIYEIKDRLLASIAEQTANALAENRETLKISGEKVLLELNKLAMTDLYSQENIIGNIDNPRLIVSASDKIKALSMLAKHLGLFERDNFQKKGASINIDNSTNKQEIQNLQVNQSLQVKFIDDNVDKNQIIDIKEVKDVKCR